MLIGLFTIPKGSCKNTVLSLGYFFVEKPYPSALPYLHLRFRLCPTCFHIYLTVALSVKTRLACQTVRAYKAYQQHRHVINCQF